MDPGLESSTKVFRDLMALLDVLTVPLMEGSLPGIVTSMEPGHLMAKTSVLIQQLHRLDGQDLVNVLLFLSAITSAREDAAAFITDELIDKTYCQMTQAESQGHQAIVGAAMTLLANIASHRLGAVIEYFMLHLQQPQCSVLKTLALIFTKSGGEFVDHLMHVMLKVKKIAKLTTDSKIIKTIHQTMATLAKALRNILGAYIEERKHPECRVAGFIILDDPLCNPLPNDGNEGDGEQLPCRHLEERRAEDNLVRHQPFKAQTSKSCDFLYHLLHQTYGFMSPEKDSCLLHDIETSKTAMCNYISHILTDEDTRRKVIYYLLEVMHSPFRSSRLISVMFFSELLCHPELVEKRMAENVTTIMASKIKSSDELEACLAIEAIGNATKSAPRRVKEMRDVIYHNLSLRLCGHREIKIVIQSLQAMSQFVRLLKGSELGNYYEEIVHLSTLYLSHRNPQIQTYSASLLADLAQKCDKDMRGFFKRHVKNYLTAFLMKMHSKDPQVKASGIAALLYCLPYIGCNSAEKLLSAEGKESWKLYHQLGQEDPVILVQMMLQSISWLHEVEKVDVLKHMSMIRDALPYDQLYPTALRDVWKGLRTLRDPQHPLVVQEASDRAVDILHTKWKSIETVEVA